MRPLGRNPAMYRLVTAAATTLLTAIGPAAVATAAAPHPTAASSATVRHVVRPVDATGQLAPGFRQTVQAHGSVDCTPPAAAAVAVDAGILSCGPSSEYAVACWRAPRAGYVRCLRNPFGSTVVRIRARLGNRTVPAVRHPVPFGLVLGDGVRCSIRDGGAWGAPARHPSWVGYYSCADGTAVWAPTGRARTSGIDESHARWTVVAGRQDGPLRRRQITDAYFVGTRH
jgi:hypothetical protein